MYNNTKRITAICGGFRFEHARVSHAHAITHFSGISDKAKEDDAVSKKERFPIVS